MPSYGKDIMQAMIEFVSSNSVIPEQHYKHSLEYKGKRLFLLLKLHVTVHVFWKYITDIGLNSVCVGVLIKHSLLSLKWNQKKFCKPEQRADTSWNLSMG